MAKYQNKYRIESARAPFWDYASNGAYFVTICIHDRVCYFGEVVDGKMVLSEIGKIAEWCWTQIPNQFPYVVLDAYVVMPNHVHGIIVIDVGRDAINRVSTIGAPPVATQLFASPPGGATGHHNPMLNENLGRIIRWFKGRTTFESRKIHADFQWQSRYHDHIIRDNWSHRTIAQYIRDNPRKWQEDRFFKR